MRIIAGKYRGKILATFEGEEVRPTADRVKESLFNILSQKMLGARVLDLFCGSGALGLECLSRGAAEAVFNDVSKDSVRILQKNIASMKLGTEARVMNYDYLTALNTLKGEFDLVFLDPPYRFDYGVPALEKLVGRGLIADDGVIIYERDCPFEGEVRGLEKYDERKYGKTVLTFFKKGGRG